MARGPRRRGRGPESPWAGPGHRPVPAPPVPPCGPHSPILGGPAAQRHAGALLSPAAPCRCAGQADLQQAAYPWRYWRRVPGALHRFRAPAAVHQFGRVAFARCRRLRQCGRVLFAYLRWDRGAASAWPRPSWRCRLDHCHCARRCHDSGPTQVAAPWRRPGRPKAVPDGCSPPSPVCPVLAPCYHQSRVRCPVGRCCGPSASPAVRPCLDPTGPLRSCHVLRHRERRRRYDAVHQRCRQHEQPSPPQVFDDPDHQARPRSEQ